MTDPTTRRSAHGRKPVPMARRGQSPRGQQPRRRRIWPWVLVAVLVVGGIAAPFAWDRYGDNVLKALGLNEVPDYEGGGSGELEFTVPPGASAWALATELHAEGVVASVDSFRAAATASDPEPVLIPGTYRLAKGMSAATALAALLDQGNRVLYRVTLPEGITAASIYQRLSEATKIPVEEFEAVGADYTSLGVPERAPNIDGYLFPATYELEPSLDARQVLQLLVNRAFQSLDAAGVAEKDRHRVLTIASLIQREAKLPKDFFKVSRVVRNRLDQGWRLEFDSTSHYGYAITHGGGSKGVWTSDKERADDNKWNTYFHTGLPIGPIAAPGDQAIEAAQQPAKGDWMYFVAVNLKTGKTDFNRTLAGHNASVAKLIQWCRQPSNSSFC